MLWFWMFGLTIVTGLNLLFRLVTILIPPARQVLKHLFNGEKRQEEGISKICIHTTELYLFRQFLILLKIRGFTQSDLSSCRAVLDHCYLGDWFVLYQLSKNSNSYFFRFLLRHLETALACQVLCIHLYTWTGGQVQHCTPGHLNI